MNIGFDAKRIFFNRSGLGNYSRGAVEALAQYAPQNSYTLFTPRRGNETGFVTPDGVKTVYPASLFNKKFSSLWRSYNMSGAISRRRIELYHGLSNELPADVRSSGAASVLTMHDIIFVHLPHLYKPFDRYIYTKKYGRSCRLADRIIAISNQTRNDLVDVWNVDPSKIDVVYQGCNPMFYHDADDAQKAAVRAKYNLPHNFILSVGTIEERKNLLRTVEAVAEGKIDTYIVACGRHTPYADKVMEYAVRNRVADRLLMLHNVEFSELPVIYRLADALVYASHYEGFGIPILEGLNSRVPVITGKGGVFAETGGRSCLYVDPNSTEEMIEAIHRVLNDTGLRRRMITAGEEHALLFRENVMAENLMNVYKRAMK